jgi:serine/threonine protein kinase
MTTDAGAWVGQMLDKNRYKVADKLGEGGMGFVYRARDRRLGCDVVIKVPRAEMLADSEFRQRFAHEIRALVQLSHPHVVKVTDVGKHDGVPFAVMQFLPGGSLEEKRSADPAALAKWLPAVAQALDFIHAQGYVHRDVKPANILFDAHGNAFISDFGVAKTLAERTQIRRGLTEAGTVLGTPEYMAPELVMGQPFDGRIDQYALAVTVYELIAGRTPFEGPTGPAILVKQTTDAPKPLTEAAPGLSPALSAAVLKALAKNPQERYPTCAAFAQAVTAAVGGAATRKTAPNTVETRRNAELNFEAQPAVKPAVPTERPRPTWIIGVAAGVALAGVAAFASFWALSRGKSEGETLQQVAKVKPPEPKADPAPPPPAPEPKVEPVVPKVEPKVQPPQEPEPKSDPAPPPPAPPEPKTQPKNLPKAPRPQPIPPRRPPTETQRGLVRTISVLTGAVKGIAVSPDGQTVVVAPNSATIRAYDVNTGSVPSSTLSHRGGGGLAYLPGGRVLVYGASDGSVHAHDFEKSRDSAMIGSHTRPVTCIAATKDVAVSGGEDGARGWNMINGRLLWQTPARETQVTDLALTSNGLTVYLAVKGVIYSRSARGGSENRRFGSAVHSLALSPDGNSLVAGCSNGKILIFDPRNGEMKKELIGHTGTVTAVAVAPDGKRVLTGGEDKTVRLWDLAETKEIGRFEGHTGDITGVAFSTDRLGVSSSTDGTVKVFNLAELAVQKDN